jgi:hypothetical protein
MGESIHDKLSRVRRRRADAFEPLRAFLQEHEVARQELRELPKRVIEQVKRDLLRNTSSEKKRAN